MCFPTFSGRSASIRAARDHAKILEDQGWTAQTYKNYKSFYEAGSHTTEEMKRIAAKGFIEEFATWEEVTARWPGAIASKVAVLTKPREDGSTKVRLIIDLRRSGGNAEVDLPERVVLPRLADLINGMIDLMTEPAVNGETGYEMAVVDFEDAFHTMALREAHRGTMAIQTVTRWAVFRIG